MKKKIHSWVLFNKIWRLVTSGKVKRAKKIRRIEGGKNVKRAFLSFFYRKRIRVKRGLGGGRKIKKDKRG